MTPQVAQNPYEMAARQRKAATIADAMRRHDWTADEAAALTLDQWAEIAEGIRTKAPSQATVDLVLETLRRFERVSDSDPFEGLPRG